MRRFSWPMFVAFLAALTLLITLGTWQVQRMGWKRHIIERVAALQGAAPRPLGEMLDAEAHGQDVEYARVRTECAAIGPKVIYLYSLYEGAPGWRPVVACRLADQAQSAVLVDLGFRPGEAGAPPPVQTLALQPGQALVGVLRRPAPPPWFDKIAEGPPTTDGARWFRRDIPTMAEALGAADPAPLMLMVESPKGGPDLVTAPLPASIPNRHLEYVLTWYGLALALSAVYIAKLLRDRKV